MDYFPAAYTDDAVFLLRRSLLRYTPLRYYGGHFSPHCHFATPSFRYIPSLAIHAAFTPDVISRLYSKVHIDHMLLLFAMPIHHMISFFFSSSHFAAVHSSMPALRHDYSSLFRLCRD